jgi:lysine 2,3-aminomutase
LVEPTEEELNIAIDYLLNSGVEEVILSGGDPLFLNNDRLKQILERLHSIPTIRIHTRAPITFPSRVNEGLIRTLSVHSNIWVIVHCNHAQELNDEVKHGLQSVRNAGIPLLNQSVLLKGVNDDAAILAELSRTLVRIGVFPYYLHHTDRVQGAEDFFVSLQDGMAVYQELEHMVSGMALPKYVIDLPDGSGKIPVQRYINRLNLLQK